MLMQKSLLVLVASAVGGLCASLTAVSSFGANPTKINMYIYVPDKVAAKPAIIVAMHGCLGSAQGFYSQTQLPKYADTNGFILIYPGTPNQSNCWDVQNPATLTHGAGGDAAGIISMVNYTLTKYNGDPAKVFVMGSSSGAMMTNVMAAVYPDVFEAGAAFSGTAHACFAGAAAATPMAPNQTCAQGLSHSGAEWANFVHNSYPSFKGKYPRMMIFHGLADTLVNSKAAVEALKQWSTVLDVTLAKNVTGVPSSAYTQQIYGDGTKLQGFFGQGVGHTAPVNEVLMLKFFGITS